MASRTDTESKTNTVMEPYDPKIAPAPFPLNNTGVICHFNSLLQSLASQSVLIKTVLINEEYLKKTGTGTAFLTFIKSLASVSAEGDVTARATVSSDAARHSAAILTALVRDLAARRPAVRFGASQESASEGLVHLLDMMEPPVPSRPATAEESGLAAPPGGVTTIRPTSVESPITRLFLHRYLCDIHCKKCKHVVSSVTDLAVQFNLFYFDRLRVTPTDDLRFSEAIRRYINEIEDYRCPNCRKAIADTCTCEHCTRKNVARKAADAAIATAVATGKDTSTITRPAECICAHCAPKGGGYRLYRLSMIPEIAVILFNLYRHPRPSRFIPKALYFEAKVGGHLTFRQTAAVEHFGALSGGHYTARALRGDGKVYLLNDAAPPTTSSFAATPNTYIAMYHFTGMSSQRPVTPTTAQGSSASAAAAAAATAATTTTTTTTTTSGAARDADESSVNILTEAMSTLNARKASEPASIA